MNVGITLNGTDLGRSGIGVFTNELLPRLIQSLFDLGHTVHVFATSKDRESYANQLKSHENQIHLVPLPKFCNHALLSALYHYFFMQAKARSLDIDIFYFPAANRRIFSSKSIKTFGVVHDIAQAYIPHKYGFLRDLYFWRLLIPSVKKLHKLIAVSHATRTDLSQLGIAEENIVVIHNGCTLFTSPESDAQQGQDSGPYLLYPARLEHPGKNHLRVIEAYAKSVISVDYKLVLTGADWGAEELIKELIAKLKLEHKVLIKGHLDFQNYQSLMLGAAAVICPGLREGFCIPALEAALHRKHILAANTGAIPTYLGHTPVYCNPFIIDDIRNAFDELLESIISDIEPIYPIKPEEFTWEYCAQQTVDVLQAQ